jgi:hypothetical protein
MANPPAPSKNPSFVAAAPASVGTASAIPPARVDFMRPELANVLAQYTLIDDCLAGSVAVKAKGPVYLPIPDATQEKPRGDEIRYEAYKSRAVFYGVSKRTLSGFLGQVFSVEPEYKVPETLNAVIKDANGSGVTLAQLAQEIERNIIAKGRGGILIDYPRIDRVVTREEQLKGEIRPTLNFYVGQSIINWRTEKRGSKTIYTLIVLAETYEEYDDGFAIKYSPQYRVLRLIDGKYQVEVWRGEAGAMAPVPELTVQPRDGKGQPLTEIPFTFVGAVDNSARVDDPPLFDLCDLNIAHYRNSADYEEAVFITGQPTPVVSGIDEHWYKNVMNETVNFGSRGGIALPAGASAELLQMQEQTAAFQAMEHKERQMVALGAKLVEQTKVQRTATEADIEESSETSILKTITSNVSEALTFALEWAAIFQGDLTVERDANIKPDAERAIFYKLNTEFDLATASPEEINSAINAWMKEAITYEEMRRTIKAGGLGYQDDKEAQAAIRQQRMDMGDNNEERNGFGA